MQGLGSKLSKHVLGMKFMRKTKDNLDQDTTEQNHRKHFGVKVDLQKPKSSEQREVPAPAVKKAKGQKVAAPIVPVPSSKITAVIEETSSYSQCLGYSFGRCSFGGFNPTVEYNVKRGRWRTGFTNATQDESDDEEGKEKDVSDEEMAELRANVIGSMGRRFKTKKQRNEQGDSRKDNPILEESNSRRGRRQPNWKNEEQAAGSGSWLNGHGQALRKSGSNTSFQESPPQKRRKFMKPSDD